MIEQHILEAQAAADDLLEQLDRGPGARELALAKTKLEEAELWLEKSKKKHDEAA